MKRSLTGCAVAMLVAVVLASATPSTAAIGLTTDAIYLPATTSDSVGAVYQYVDARHGADAKGYLPVVHSYSATNSDGYNVFVGEDAGNFGGIGGIQTSSECLQVGGDDRNPDSWKECYRGSYNVGIGREALHRVTVGYGNVGIGE